MENILFHITPAENFEESYVLGNGHLGAAVYGNPLNDTISLNHDTLWSGYPEDEEPECYEAFLKSQDLILENKFEEAHQVIADNLFYKWSQIYLSLGKLSIETNHSYTDYKRELNMESGICSVSYKVNDTTFKREYFTSFPDNCLVIKLTADKPSSVSFKLSASTELKADYEIKNNLLIINGECPAVGIELKEPLFNYSDDPKKRGITFTQCVKVVADNVSLSNNGFEVTNSNEAIIYVCAESSYNGFDKHPFLEGKEHKNTCIEHITSLSNFDEIKETHINDFSKLYNRVSLNINGNKNYADTYTRLKDFDGTDTGLYELIFNFGRYLLISSSRPGTEATNLQGIWTKEMSPPWRSNYTININTEMNYWPSLPCNLKETFMPYLDLAKKLAVKGTETAKKFYNAKGFVTHHNTDLWGKTAPVGDSSEYEACVFAFWNMSSGWIATQLFDLYEYTMDKDILKNDIYPIMKSAAEFYLDIMVKDENGYDIISPATSPENYFRINGKPFSVCKTTTMSMSIVKELFDRVVKSCNILDIDKDFAEKLTSLNLYPFEISNDGRLMEWSSDYEENDPNHRHVSHLFSLFPGHLINKDTPELMEACKKSLDVRGDDGTGWSLGWKINLHAALFDGNRALKLLKRQLNLVTCFETDYGFGGGTYPNLLDAHPPFQIDGNFGATSGVSLMLLQSTMDSIEILPALPDLWSEGSFTGFLAKGGINVSAWWKDSKVYKLILSTDKAKAVTVKVNGKSLNVSIEAGENLIEI